MRRLHVLLAVNFSHLGAVVSCYRRLSLSNRVLLEQRNEKKAVSMLRSALNY